jgi:hypothetical protein
MKKMRNRLFKTDERINAVYKRMGTISFHILSILVWLNLIYRMVVLNQRWAEVADIIVVLAVIGILYIVIISYFIREAVMSGSKERRSGLSITSLVNGIISFLLITGILSVALYWISPGLRLNIQILQIVFLCIGGVLGVTGTVCGAVDLFRIQEGRSSVNGRGFDIAGIILGVLGIAFVMLIILSFFLISVT